MVKKIEDNDIFKDISREEIRYLSLSPNRSIHPLAFAIPKWVRKLVYTKTGEVHLTVKPQHMLEVFSYLRDHTSLEYSCLIDMTAVDYPTRKKRFEVVYQLLSVNQTRRLCVKTSVADGESLPSIVDLYKSAGWFEREVWDMYGIYFTNHPDLRRILTDYGFHGHPMRKDFPLTGYIEVRYDEEEKRVQSDKLELAQDFRFFSFENPWNKNKQK